MLAIVIGEPLGRRRELIAGSALYLAGSLVTVLAPDAGGTLGVVLTGRIIYGVGIALSMNAAPTYIAEMAPPRVRGRLVSLKGGFIVLGILVGFAASAITEVRLSAATARWRVMCRREDPNRGLSLRSAERRR